MKVLNQKYNSYKNPDSFIEKIKGNMSEEKLVKEHSEWVLKELKSLLENIPKLNPAIINENIEKLKESVDKKYSSNSGE